MGIYIVRNEIQVLVRIQNDRRTQPTLSGSQGTVKERKKQMIWTHWNLQIASKTALVERAVRAAPVSGGYGEKLSSWQSRS